MRIKIINWADNKSSASLTHFLFKITTTHKVAKENQSLASNNSRTRDGEDLIKNK